MSSESSCSALAMQTIPVEISVSCFAFLRFIAFRHPCFFAESMLM